MTARAALVVVGLALAGCGFKGPLTLPPKPGEVTIRPAPAGARPSAPADSTQPAAPAAPGPPVPTDTPEKPVPEAPSPPSPGTDAASRG
jgi:predicted small lipoprotein YifL